jgi:hypothetical protein
METAKFGDALCAGTEHQVIGIGKDDTSTARSQIGRSHGLYGRLSADRHECWSIYRTVQRYKFAETRRFVGLVNMKGEHG